FNDTSDDDADVDDGDDDDDDAVDIDRECPSLDARLCFVVG
ncbi:unnamed protein product, partial [Rotaria magnacalcarata]